MSQPNPIPELESLAALQSLSQDADDPVFAEPWQAEAFALAALVTRDAMIGIADVTMPKPGGHP